MMVKEKKVNTVSWGFQCIKINQYDNYDIK